KDHAVVERRVLALAIDRIPPFLRAFGQADEVLNGVGRFLVEEPDLEIAFGCLEIRVSGHESSIRNNAILSDWMSQELLRDAGAPPCSSYVFRRRSAARRSFTSPAS